MRKKNHLLQYSNNYLSKPSITKTKTKTKQKQKKKEAHEQEWPSRVYPVFGPPFRHHPDRWTGRHALLEGVVPQLTQHHRLVQIRHTRRGRGRCRRRHTTAAAAGGFWRPSPAAGVHILMAGIVVEMIQNRNRRL